MYMYNRKPKVSVIYTLYRKMQHMALLPRDTHVKQNNFKSKKKTKKNQRKFITFYYYYYFVVVVNSGVGAGCMFCVHKVTIPLNDKKICGFGLKK